MFCKHGGDVRGDVIVDDGGPVPKTPFTRIRAFLKPHILLPWSLVWKGHLNYSGEHFKQEAVLMSGFTALVSVLNWICADVAFNLNGKFKSTDE